MQNTRVWKNHYRISQECVQSRGKAVASCAHLLVNMAGCSPGYFNAEGDLGYFPIEGQIGIRRTAYSDKDFLSG